VATATLMPPIVTAAATAIATMTIRGCRMVPRFCASMKVADPRGTVRGVPPLGTCRRRMESAGFHRVIRRGVTVGLFIAGAKRRHHGGGNVGDLMNANDERERSCGRSRTNGRGPRATVQLDAPSQTCPLLRGGHRLRQGLSGRTSRRLLQIPWS
jgi:hypothetical protein